MKNIFIGLFATTLLANAHAANVISCDMKLSGNYVSCPPFHFFGCDKSVLEKSSANFTHDLSSDISSEIQFNRVIIDPLNKDEEKSHSILLFKNDDRHIKLKNEKKVELLSYDSKESIKYSIYPFGDKVQMSFNYESDVNRQWREVEIGLHDKAQLIFHITGSRPVVIECKMISQAVNNDEMRKNEAIEQYKKEKSSADAGVNKQ